MLVAGQRDYERRLYVHQAWRLYSARVDIRVRLICRTTSTIRDVYGRRVPSSTISAP